MHRLSRFALACAALIVAAAPVHAKPKYEQVDSPLLTKAPIAGDFWMGKENAPITLIEYASLTCPHCAKFHEDVLPELTKRYIDTGKMLYILRPYPLNEPALKAAMLIDCVGEEGNARYFTFARVLFDAQNKWAFDPRYLTALETFARVGGVSREKFDECLLDTKREAKILTIKKDATQELKVNRTPYLFINARRYDANPSMEAVTSYIDGLLLEKQSAPAKPKKAQEPASPPERPTKARE